MNPEKIQNQINQTQKKDQYTTPNVPFHKHNNIDSPRIKASDLDGGFYLLKGFAQLSAGSVTITNSRIKTTSVIVVTSQDSGTGPNIAAICNAGNARIFEASGGRTDVVNYIIAI